MDTVKLEPRTTPSPYGGSLSPFNQYGASPIYMPNILSPQTQQSWASPTQAEPLPSMGEWNIQNTDYQIDIQNLDSGEINRQIATGVGLLNSLPNLEISSSDIAPNDDQNMSDSINRLVNCRIGEMYPN